MNGACNSKNILAPPSGTLGKGQKVKNYLISITGQFQRLVYQTLCVFCGQKYFLSNMVMCHIKTTGVTSRTECK